MIIKYGIKNFSRNLFFNILIIIQLALVFSSAIFTSSSVYQNLKYYSVFADELNGNGYCVLPQYFDGDSTQSIIFTNDLNDSKRFSDYGDYFGDISALYRFTVYGQDGTENPYLQNTYGYNGVLIYNYMPSMKKGKWLSQVESNDNVIHAVISDNDYGLDVGDRIKQGFPTDNGIVDLDVEISGMIKDGAKLYGAKVSGKHYDDTVGESFSVNELFYNYYLSAFHCPVFIYNMDEFDKYNISAVISDKMMVPFKDDLSDTEQEDAFNAMIKFGTGEVGFSQIKDMSLVKVKQQLIILVPVIVGLMVLTIVSILSLSAISTHKQLKNYGILYICGSRWRQCALINIINIVIDILFSVLITYSMLTILDFSGKLENTVVIFEKNELRICTVIAMIVIFVSAIMPFAIIGKTQPKEILKAEE